MRERCEGEGYSRLSLTQGRGVHFVGWGKGGRGGGGARRREVWLEEYAVVRSTEKILNELRM